MKFLMDSDGLEAVNIKFVKSIALISVTFKKDDDAIEDDELEDDHSRHKKITVDAELDDVDGYSITLAEFDSGEYEKDFQDAKNYLAELVKNLNGEKE